MLPEEVRQLLEHEKKFTNGKADVDVVDGLYRAFFEGTTAVATILTFKQLSWGAQEIGMLILVLPHFKALRSLDLSENKLNAQAATGIAGYLRASASLTSLGLGFNKLQDEGIASICDA